MSIQAESEMPTAVDIRCMPTPDLKGIAKFCRSELRQFSKVRRKPSVSGHRRFEKLYSMIRIELRSRSVVLP